MYSLLFVCTANRYRSPIAAAIFQNKLQVIGVLDNWRVDSAGTWTEPGLKVVPRAQEAALSLGLNLDQHQTTLVSEDLLSAYDLIIVMEKGHKEALISDFPDMQERLYLLSEIVEDLAYSIPDPARYPQDAEVITREFIQLIQQGFINICQVVEKLHNKTTR